MPEKKHYKLRNTIPLPGFFFAWRHTYQAEFFRAGERTILNDNKPLRISHPDLLLIWFGFNARRKLGMRYHAYLFTTNGTRISYVDCPNSYDGQVCLGRFPDRSVRKYGIGNVFWQTSFNTHYPEKKWTSTDYVGFLHPAVYEVIREIEWEWGMHLFEEGRIPNLPVHVL